MLFLPSIFYSFKTFSSGKLQCPSLLVYLCFHIIIFFLLMRNVKKTIFFFPKVSFMWNMRFTSRPRLMPSSPQLKPSILWHYNYVPLISIQSTNIPNVLSPPFSFLEYKGQFISRVLVLHFLIFWLIKQLKKKEY